MAKGAYDIHVQDSVLKKMMFQKGFKLFTEVIQ